MKAWPTNTVEKTIRLRISYNKHQFDAASNTKVLDFR
jgi:hypothetical protein